MTTNQIQFNEFLQQNLNDSQLKAVEPDQGILLVVAGAGSGKTRVITSRIANLIINYGEQPNSILAVTFTNKAANEMKERIHNWLDDENHIPFVGTFHSLCLKILKNNRNILSIPQFTILDEEDQLKLLQSIVKKFSIKKLNPRQIAYNISAIKNSLAVDNDSSLTFGENKLLQEIYLAYETERINSKCLDFDDLIIETLKLFKNNQNFKKQFQNQIKHILVDEYQDTSTIQHELLKQMAIDHNGQISAKSLCIVGDEDQSIYSWRGATIENIVNFKKDFPDTSVIKIEQNYRSVQQILDVANNVIANNEKRNPKNLWSDKKAKNRAIQILCGSEYQEGDLIAQAVKTASKNKSVKSIAVLYRTHYQSRTIEEALIKNSLAYTIIGGIEFYERKEIKDILAYMRLMVNPFDRISFFRVINCPTRGLGEKFEEDFYKSWSDEPFLNFIDISNKIISEKNLTKSKEESLKNFLEIIKTDSNKDEFSQDNVLNFTPSMAINHIVSSCNYFTYLKNNYLDDEAETKIENVKELIRAANHFEAKGINTVSLFLEEIALMQQQMIKKGSQDNTVQLMTLHAAKGLEFDTVIISGLEEGILPSSRSFELDHIEEERRLFYVGITRAREYLILSHAQQRNSFGQISYQSNSRFLDEIPNSLIVRENSSHLNSSYFFQNIFSEFFNVSTSTNSIMTFGSHKTNMNFKEIKKDSYSNSDLNTNSKWKEHQPVKHEIFGIGIIKKIENKSDGKIFITVKFRDSLKKLDSQFLQKA